MEKYFLRFLRCMWRPLRVDGHHHLFAGIQAPILEDPLHDTHHCSGYSVDREVAGEIAPSTLLCSKTPFTSAWVPQVRTFVGGVQVPDINSVDDVILLTLEPRRAKSLHSHENVRVNIVISPLMLYLLHYDMHTTQ